MNFTSDNCWGASPEVIAALSSVNSGAAQAYGDDQATSDLNGRMATALGCPCAVFPVPTGTAANAIAIAALMQTSGLIYCHQNAHIYGQEAGAVEHMAHASRLVQIPGAHGKIDPAALDAALSGAVRTVHYMEPNALSLSQATELGAVYTIDEIKTLTAIAKKHNLLVHMDGARFANAVVRLGCSPAELTWQAGIDILSFGATKNGTLCADAIVLFKPELTRNVQRLLKRSGSMVSKMRFLSAQLTACLTDDLWLNNARRANQAAQNLAAELAAIPSFRLSAPVETNAVFVDIPTAVFQNLDMRGSPSFHRQENGYTRVRYMTSFCTPDADIQAFCNHLRALADKHSAPAQ